MKKIVITKDETKSLETAIVGSIGVDLPTLRKIDKILQKVSPEGAIYPLTVEMDNDDFKWMMDRFKAYDAWNPVKIMRKMIIGVEDKLDAANKE